MSLYQPRIKALQSYLRRQKIDAVLITQPENRRYLSGYSALDSTIQESSGALLVFSQADPLLLTDFRFLDQARADTEDMEIILYKRGLFALIASLFARYSVKTLAFEPYYFLHSSFRVFHSICASHQVDLTEFSDFLVKRRLIKDRLEIVCIQRSVALNEAVFSSVYKTLRLGMSEVEIALALENGMRLHGAERPSFETIVASGPNGALPHAVPGKREIVAGEPIIIDMGLVLDGYCSDMTRTVVLGEPDEKTLSLIRLVRKAQLHALSALRPGRTGKAVDAVARDIIVEGGYGPQFGHGLGHGVGLAIHEAPSLNPRNRKMLRSGMIVTVEPGIYISGWGGVRLENMALVTDAGHLLLNKDTTFLDV